MTVKESFQFNGREMEFADEEMVRFIRNQLGKSKSDRTVMKYARGLEQYSLWIEAADKEVTKVDFIDLENYLSHLTNEKEYADKTVHTKFVPVRLFYGFLKKLGTISDNPVEDVDTGDYYRQSKTRRGEVTGKERIFLSKQEIKALIDNAPDPSLRNRLLIKFIYYTGLRLGEVSEIKVDDLDREERKVLVTVKGGDTLTAVWHEDMDGLMTQWLDYGYRVSYPTASDSPYLFLTNSSGQLSETHIGRIIDEAAQNAGLQEVLYVDAAGKEQKRITTHTLRHSFSMNFLNDGGSLEALSNRLAHNSITTTEIYGEILDDRGIEEYNRVMQGLDVESE